MSPRTGRPPKADTKRNQLTIRIGDETAKMLKECAEAMNTSRTDVIERGIALVHNQLKEQK